MLSLHHTSKSRAPRFVLGFYRSEEHGREALREARTKRFWRSAAIYRARSPLHHVEQLSCPVIFLQGLDDKTYRLETSVRALWISPSDDPRSPRGDPRYAALAPAQVPLTENLADTVERFLPCWHERIAPARKEAAHGVH